MNEEEQKAIDMLNTFRLEHKFFNIRQADNLEDNIEIVLNLIDKLQKENEEKTIVLLAGAEKVKQLQKEKEELYKQIDKMNSFTNDTIKKYNKFIIELNQEFQNFAVMENKK